MGMARRCSLGFVAAVACAHVAAPVSAQESGILTASGEQLYQQGKKLYADKKYSEACARFLASQRADPASGTLFYLGLCSEKDGKTATAYGYFLDAVAFARREGGPASAKKIEAAQGNADRLEKKLAHLTISVDASAKVDGLQIKRDEIVLDTALLGVALPVDVGDHVVEASAPGYVAQRSTVTVKKDGDTTTILVTPLTKEPPKPEPVVEPPPDLHARSGVLDGGSATGTSGLGDEQRGAQLQHTIGWTVGVVGVVGLLTSAGFGLAARSRWSTAQPSCPNDLCTSQSAQSASDDAHRYATVSTVSFLVGAVGVATGLVLVLTGDNAPMRSGVARVDVAPAIGPRALGLSLGGQF
jgi:hypothetical protein